MLRPKPHRASERVMPWEDTLAFCSTQIAQPSQALGHHVLSPVDATPAEEPP